MKGILLAGGLGTRLFPSTNIISKQLLPVYDKPLIYYSLSILMLSKIKNILLISSINFIDDYKKLFGDGSNFGLKLQYQVQEKPGGVPQAFLIGENFIKNDNVCLVLGDNICFGNNLSNILLKAKNDLIKNNFANIFGYNVNNPQDYGVVEFNNKNNKIIKIVEKPKILKSSYAIPGIYFYPNNVSNFVKKLKPVKSGELEITDLNNLYLKKKKLNLNLLGRGLTWLDAGDPEELSEAAYFIQTIEKRQGLKISCIEEIALNLNFINYKKFIKIINKYPKKNQYYKYLSNIIKK